MRIFHKSESWSDKINFIDENNVVMGYDLSESCCEHADWFISDKQAFEPIARENTEDGTPEDMPGWNFDRSFFREIENISVFDEGSMVIFRITKGDSEKFIHIFNCHNGYYHHGFEFSDNGITIKQGSV